MPDIVCFPYLRHDNDIKKVVNVLVSHLLKYNKPSKILHFHQVTSQGPLSVHGFQSTQGLSHPHVPPILYDEEKVQVQYTQKQ